MILTAVLSALLNVAILAGFPFLLYWLFHQRWRKRGFGEIAARAGLRLGETRYLGYSLAFAATSVAALVLWPPPLEAVLREGSASRSFAGLGLTVRSVALALLYGMIKTGFSEELLFRGLIAGSLARRLPLAWANLAQALIFLAPHLLLLWIMPELWALLILVFFASLLLGWLRIRSGSILGPWLIHGAANVAMSLSVAIRSA